MVDRVGVGVTEGGGGRGEQHCATRDSRDVGCRLKEGGRGYKEEGLV